MKVLLCLVLGFAPLVTPARAAAPDSSAAQITESAATPLEMRARLAALAQRLAAVDRSAAGEAWYHAGRSFEFDGQGDSAIAAYRRAVELRGAGAEHLAAVDALFRRNAPGDEETALQLARATLAVDVDQSAGQPHYLRARIAWAQYLSGQTAEARTQFARLERSISGDMLWRLRLGRVFLEANDPMRAYTMLLPAAVASRGRSQDAMQLLERSVDAIGLTNRFDEEMQYAIAIRDRDEKVLVTALGGRRVRFAAADSFPLGGTLIPGAGRGTHPAAVILVTPGDTLASWDSLAVALRRAGISTLVLDLRGGGWSVERSCPLPVAWEGRRSALIEQCAGDVGQAVRALATGSTIQASRYVVIAAGPAAGVALAAAERDPRVAALALLSPRFEPAERGPALARAARVGVPVYLTMTGIDVFSQAWIEPLYRACPPGASRVSEVLGNGAGPEALRDDAAATERLIRWIKETKPVRGKASPRPE